MTKTTRSRAALGRACMAGVLCVSTALLSVPCAGALAGGVEVANAEKASAAAQIESEVTSRILEVSGEYADSIFKSVVGCADVFDIDASLLTNVSYGTPFIIYGIDDEDGGNDTFYYPVVNNDTGKVLLVVDMFQVANDDGWTHGISTEYVDGLNAIGYGQGGFFLFYANGNAGNYTVVADNGMQTHLVQGTMNSALQSYATKDYVGKLDDANAKLATIGTYGKASDGDGNGSEEIRYGGKVAASAGGQSITLSTANVTIKRGGKAVVKVSGAKGKLKVKSNYAKVVAKASGKKKVSIRVKKGAERGTYKVKVRAKAAKGYVASKAKTIVVKVK